MDDYPVLSLEIPQPFSSSAGVSGGFADPDLEFEVLQNLATSSEEPSEVTEEFSDVEDDAPGSRLRSKNLFSYRSYSGDLGEFSEDELNLILKTAGVPREELTEDQIRSMIRKWLMPKLDYTPTFSLLLEPENAHLLESMLSGERPMKERSLHRHPRKDFSVPRHSIPFRYKKFLRSFGRSPIVTSLIDLLSQFVNRICNSLPLGAHVEHTHFSCSSKLSDGHECLIIRFNTPLDRKICHAMTQYYGYLSSCTSDTREGKLMRIKYNGKFKLEKPPHDLAHYMDRFL